MPCIRIEKYLGDEATKVPVVEVLIEDRLDIKNNSVEIVDGKTKQFGHTKLYRLRLSGIHSEDQIISGNARVNSEEKKTTHLSLGRR